MQKHLSGCGEGNKMKSSKGERIGEKKRMRGRGELNQKILYIKWQVPLVEE